MSFAFRLLNHIGPADTVLTETVHPSLLGAYDKAVSRIWQQIVQYSSTPRRALADRVRLSSPKRKAAGRTAKLNAGDSIDCLIHSCTTHILRSGAACRAATCGSGLWSRICRGHTRAATCGSGLRSGIRRGHSRAATCCFARGAGLGADLSL